MDKMNQKAGNGVPVSGTDVFANDPIPMVWRRLSNAPRRFTLPKADWNYEKLMEKLRKLDPQFDREKEEVFYTDKRGNNIFFMTTDEMEAMLEHFHRWMKKDTVEIELITKSKRRQAGNQQPKTWKKAKEDEVPELTTEKKQELLDTFEPYLLYTRLCIEQPKEEGKIEEDEAPLKIIEKEGVRNSVALFRITLKEDAKQFAVTFSHGPHCQLRMGDPVNLYCSDGEKIAGVVFGASPESAMGYVVIDVTLPQGRHSPPPMFQGYLTTYTDYTFMGYSGAELCDDEVQQPAVRLFRLESTQFYDSHYQLKGGDGSKSDYDGVVFGEAKRIVGLGLSGGPFLRILPIYKIVASSSLLTFLKEYTFMERIIMQMEEKEEKKKNANAIPTTSFELNEPYKMPSRRLYEILTSIELIPKWAGGKGVVMDASGQFSYFNGLISGQFTNSVGNEELAAKFRLRSYPEGWYADVSFALKDSDRADITELVIKGEGVPKERVGETEMVFSHYYFRSIGKTFDGGLRIY